MRAQVMKRAWEIAKEAVKKFGGKVREYISEAMKMAWAEVKEVKAQIKEWFEYKLAEEFGLPRMFYLDIFCGIKETEKAIYAMFYTGYNATGHATRKCGWIPKSCIENIEALKFMDYDEAVNAFKIEY